jgi:hypothetical protein
MFKKIQKVQKEILNVAGHGQNNANIEILKEILDGFSYFSLIKDISSLVSGWTTLKHRIDNRQK